MDLTALFNDPKQPNPEKAALTQLLAVPEVERVGALKRLMEAGEVAHFLSLVKKAKLSPIALNNLLKFSLLRADAWGAVLIIRTVKDTLPKAQLLGTIEELKEEDPERHRFAVEALAKV